MDAMQKKKEEMKREFLSLSPLERIRKMNSLWNDVISFRARQGGVSEYEVYRRYIKTHQRSG